MDYRKENPGGRVACIRGIFLALALVVSAALTFSCAPEPEELSISHAEEAGFEKGDQLAYQTVEAEAGWTGEWAGDRVELYQYESEEAVQKDYFDGLVQEETVAGWVELCQAKNLLMLSDGESACRELEDLAD